MGFIRRPSHIFIYRECLYSDCFVYFLREYIDDTKQPKSETPTKDETEWNLEREKLLLKLNELMLVQFKLC